MYNMILYKTAIIDLKQISAYMSLNNPFLAKKVLDDIYASIEYLKEFPYLWKERKDWLRELVIKYKFRVFYKIKHETVYIVSIFKYKEL